MAKLSREQIMSFGRKLQAQGDLLDLLTYFQDLSEENYQSFKKSDSEMNDIHKGYALCIDNLSQVFEACLEEDKQKPLFTVD